MHSCRRNETHGHTAEVPNRGVDLRLLGRHKLASSFNPSRIQTKLEQQEFFWFFQIRLESELERT